jgi:hypothetical protein
MMARVWGRNNNSGQWIQIATDAAGNNDAVNLTWLAQVLLLNLNESPFWGDWGIPAQQSIETQIPPDYYVVLTQQRFAQYFPSLIISKRAGLTTPTYDISAVLNQGVSLSATVAVPI